MIWLIVGMLAVAVLLILSAFFSSSEIAFVSVNRAVIADEARKGNEQAIRLERLMENPSNVITAVVVGNNIVNVSASVIAGAISTAIFGNLGIGIATFVMTALVLVFSEITPKAFGMRNKSYALRVSSALSLITKLFAPVVFLLNRLSNAMISMVREGEDEGTTVTEDQIMAMMRLGEEQGTIEEDEREMVNGVFEFDETQAREFYTPKEEVEFLSQSDTIDDLIDRSMETGYSRFPVYGENVDDIVGMAHVKDTFGVEDGSSSVKKIMRGILRIPPRIKADDILRQMQRSKTHLALLHNSSGKTLGLVSIEDVMEEVFGEISDEHDPEVPGENSS